ncbi:Os08g0420800 [Oryza sativa Japonica Group]|uniref:Os08g0420800 protein n=1 Tax=Oryza sativa subsp. japonica TaxID=39947 RepID=Q7EYS6_ORYSJ|nr:unknown protein [Oryza sativa Japonica Group]BAC99453.1 unknown protein [Oryza sativa Japonica Group]BAF23734.1 Os08g0420800 [Oryza sativa Japonica Group]|eukprot:NP_001061820.1 Os08g0420800 [Oryza sativa Japonica Group]
MDSRTISSSLHMSWRNNSVKQRTVWCCLLKKKRKKKLRVTDQEIHDLVYVLGSSTDSSRRDSTPA